MTRFSFDTPRPRRRGENVVPMINIVFLLLIFFLISAQIAPPRPFALTQPEGLAADRISAQPNTLWIGADGALAFGEARGPDVWAALGTARGALHIEADQGLPAVELARVLSRLKSYPLSPNTLLATPTGGS